MAAATAALLLPFAGKAFHMDDTLFLWTARQIVERPWDFYGFSGNWDGALSPATEIIKNPPLAAYYMALAASIFGWTEEALHAAFILPAFMAVWGTYAVASRMGASPLLAAGLTLAAPAFLVSATTLMCDVMTAAFWAWAVFFWIKGVDEEDRLCLALSGALVSLSALTKYFGVSLIPLLAAYSILKGRRGHSALLFLLIPVAALAGYNLYTWLLYGKGLLLDASGYAAGLQAASADRLDRAVIGLVFTGGTVITALFFLLAAWGLRALIPGLVLVVGLCAWLASTGSLGGVELWAPGFGWGYAAQLAVYGAAGAGVFALVVSDLVRRKDAFSVLLGLWVAGTFAFTVFFNWTVNARSILPMAPAVAVLLARAADDERLSAIRLWLPVGLALAVSLAVAWADMRLANSAKDAATLIAARHSGGPGTLWFQGHWGFQYYMEDKGAKPIEWKETRVGDGDKIAFPFNNSGLRLLPEDRFSVVEDFAVDPSPYLSTMTLGPGAGFYASEWGPLPFMLVPPNEERYQVLAPVWTGPGD